MAWIKSITDRTQEDVDLLLRLKKVNYEDMSDREKALWLSDLKGAMNVSDVLRIENNMAIMSDFYRLDLETKTTADAVIYDTWWQRVVSNIAKIREMGVYRTTPKMPSLPINSYSQVNALEQILEDSHQIVMNNYYHDSADELNSGEDIGLIL